MGEIRQRTCVGCGVTLTKSSLVRFVRDADGVVRVDEKGRAAGRGAYLCRNRTCFDAARKAKGLERALRVRIGEADWLRLEHEFDLLCAGHSDVQ
jgi:predicted RNA-binding protein YlxR (DUF448 family)